MELVWTKNCRNSTVNYRKIDSKRKPSGTNPPRDDADYPEKTNKVAVEDVTETSSMLKPKKDYLDNKAGSRAECGVVFLVFTMLVLPLMFRRGT
ncbi:hypothetical protein CEXT_665611 [Caerostris extrusa]|uniref:Uncharacterized protein n=1 Tax=Caerostris extrusa TaxID=172846 RepID=A0AAV4XPL1_CAEEX|nr:hypothetical protein CEXT_665611 [Caerostris extrusa]